jgi:hypothetical protein
VTSLTYKWGYFQNYRKSQLPYIHCDFHSNLMNYILLPITAQAISHTLYHSLYHALHQSCTLNLFSRVKHSLIIIIIIIIITAIEFSLGGSISYTSNK